MALSIPRLLWYFTQLGHCFGPQPALAPSSVLLGISPSMFLPCKDHGGSRYLLLSACGVFFLLNLPERIEFIKGLREEMSANPLN